MILTEEDLLRRAIPWQLHGSVLLEPSIVATRLGDDRQLTLNPDVPFYPACMMKLPLCVAAGVLLSRGEIEDIPIKVSADQVTECAGTSPFHEGAVVELYDLIYQALYHSDNTAGNVLLDLVGRERGTAVLHEYGLLGTALRRWLVGITMKPDPLATGRNQHSARDAVALLSLLHRRAIPNASLILGAMDHSNQSDLSAYMLTPSDRLYVKDGYTSSVTNIGMLVEAADGESYAIAVYTNMAFSNESYRRVVGFCAELRGLLSLGSPRTSTMKRDDVISRRGE